ncbi:MULTISPECIES: hypothetical protein [unclassified Candidatus Frackibacter]|uniref:hypothetical protein n=1 Tax=unclassified Candidatus Frackibacter TaxID=2648818 RepID=UPI0015A19690|nr:MULTISPECIES: hypothetical protein [unclassified Candidatus Frackibacter]
MTVDSEAQKRDSELEAEFIVGLQPALVLGWVRQLKPLRSEFFRYITCTDKA